ncbi:LysR family transcriptional regulator [Cupriavidus taiwanensis]|uniref:Transcriptional regulator LysR family n=1 Tax=Cupriavidus taiwanensis TaxID=164546 RepID=A0A7Z7NQE5_9BURK|nr:LysR family transcriptional regulator [Cupriavidus taiwanensis]SOZ19506.1 Transcriptional regulator LysR family [Cupriavidus taiwanensis]SOZ97307.1 Transcriptional regulator LysR family [Cupriavidus taiwanensis]SPC26195.1 Transcriptional regulator LysR family [Cupriavidus taiwanensis]SPD37670.1 Transcriptional regulator LysR family [Cupriavidus taiwanensis]
MLTIKELETFYWVARLGTLEKAAVKLHVTRSAVTKRLREVEESASMPLFEGDNRKNLLTPAGKELLGECERLLEVLARLEKMKGLTQQPARTLHAGLTELSALTWFGAFLKRMKSVYPTVTVQPEIDFSSLLQAKVEDGRLDLAILPELPSSSSLASVDIGHVQFGWFTGPGIFPTGEKLSLRDLAAQPVIEQSEHSIITRLCARLWEDYGLQPERIYGGNNVVALAGLVAAGVGISCLPVSLFSKEVAQGKMELIETSPPAPSVRYVCVFPQHPNAEMGYSVAEIARQCCTFSIE